MFYITRVYLNPQTGEEYRLSGSEHEAFIHDLKTVDGLRRRIKKWKMPANVVRVEIYTYSEMYRENTYRLVGAVVPAR